MANDHGEQIRIVQETVAGKEITFAHVMGGPAPIIYQKLGLNPQLDYRSSAIHHEHDAAGVCRDRFGYRSEERQCLSRIRGPFYWHTDRDRRDFRCDNSVDAGCGIFPRYAGICCLQHHEEIGSVRMARMTREEFLEYLFHDNSCARSRQGSVHGACDQSFRNLYIS